MVWISSNDREAKAIQEIVNLPDRAAAIVAAALLDQKLDVTLKARLFDANLGSNNGGSVHKRMFGVGQPCGTFSARINLGFMIGLYSAGARADLDIINRIRNKFAHDLDITDFAGASDLCRNLSNFEKHYVEYGMPGPEGLLAMSQPDLVGSLANPRERFMMAVRLYFADMQFPSAGPTRV